MVMHNPIHKRILRMALAHPGKVLPLLTALLLMTAFMSSFFIAQHTVEDLYYQQMDEGRVEDGQWTTLNPLQHNAIQRLTNKGLTVYENFYKDISFGKDKTLRLYKNRIDVNLPIMTSGRLPEKDYEIAVSANLAKVDGFHLGDRLTLEGQAYTITGLITTPDYSSLLKNRHDLVMDTGYFGIAMVTDQTFYGLTQAKTNYCYAYQAKPPVKKTAAQEQLEDCLKLIQQDNQVLDGVTRYENRCITYLMDDMGGDVPMMMTLLVLCFIALAFMSGMQSRSLIEEEAPVIGTLLASGYKRRELFIHYMATPSILTLVAILAGNGIAYAGGYHLYAGLYATSYSLPPFVPVMDLRALLLAGVIPFGLVVGINALILFRALGHRPLAFLRSECRHDRKRRNRFTLQRFSFLNTAKIRVLLDNKGNILALFFGLFIANSVLIFGLSLEPMFLNYADHVKHEMPYDTVTLVKGAPSEAIRAKKGVVTNLDVRLNGEKKRISFYGMDRGSRYHTRYAIDALKEGQVAVSHGFAGRYGVKKNDVITVSVPYASKTHRLVIKKVMEDVTSVQAVLPMTTLNHISGHQPSFYNAYFSDRKPDLPADLIVTVIDRQDISRYLSHFMASFAGVFKATLAVSLSFYFLLLYLISKLILDKSTKNISYFKILGFTNSEISRIYMNSIRNAVIVYYWLSVPLLNLVLNKAIKASMVKVDVYLDAQLPHYVFLLTLALGLAVYLVVQRLQMRKIAKMDMVQSLKTVSG